MPASFAAHASTSAETVSKSKSAFVSWVNSLIRVATLAMIRIADTIMVLEISCRLRAYYMCMLSRLNVDWLL
jgi:hypothetical protein